MNGFISSAVPIYENSEDTGNYRTVSVDLNHPQFSESLVDVGAYGIASENYYARTDGENAPYFKPISGALPSVWVRKEAAERLAVVDYVLASIGIELFVVDGYRPLTCQKGIWDFFWARVRQENPFARNEQVYREVVQYVSDPDSFSPENPATWPTHITGGSVDVLLRDKKTSRLLNMGAHFDEMSVVSHTAFFEERLAAREICIHDPRLVNRRTLHSVMTAVGFTNYRNEFWHFDIGNQLHEYTLSRMKNNGRTSQAKYGYALSPIQ